MKVCIIARVSTDDKEQNPESQLIPCRKYCKDHSHTIITEIVDHYTGRVDIFSRPDGSRLKYLLQDKKIEGIVVFSVDRFSREDPIKVIHQLRMLESEHDCKFISITEPIFNMESEFAEPMKYMLSWFSNYWITQHIKKVKSGMDRAKSEGVYIGRPPKGYTCVGGVLAPKEEEKYIPKIGDVVK